MVDECLLIEPTETESLDELNQFLAVMQRIYDEMHESPELLKKAPHTLTISRADEVRAAKQLILTRAD